MRSAFHGFRLILCLPCNLTHHADEAVNSLLALVFGRLNHHRLMEKQWEIYRRCMIAEVQKALRHVHGGHADRLVAQAVEHELMLAQALYGQFIHVLQALLYVVGVERGERPHKSDVLPSECKYVGIRLHVHAEVAKECTHADVSFAAGLYLILVTILDHTRLRQELLQPASHADRAASRSASAVRSGESLMKIDVHHVEPHVARAADTKHRVEVCSVIIHQRATVVHHFSNLRYARLEQAERVGIGHHHRGHRVIKQFVQMFNVHRTVSRAFHLDHFKSTDCRRSRIGSVGRVGHYHLCPLHVAPAFMISTDNHQPRKLAMRPCKGIQGEFRQASDGRQRLLQVVINGQCALARADRLHRMSVRELLAGCHFLIDVRIVFHGTAAQWIETVVHSEVVSAHIGIMTHNGKLVTLGQSGIFRAPHGLRQLVISICVFRQRASPAPIMRQLEYQFAI